MQFAEIVATLLGIANIALLVRRSIWNYPFGLAMVAIYTWIFAGAKLYSDALLQLFFFVVQLYGWWAWARADGAGADGIVVLRLRTAARLAWLAGALVGTLAWGRVMARHTDAAYPFWDGGIAIFSLCAQILLARRYLENWVVWIGVDVAAIGLYAARGLYPTTGLYILFLLFAIAGLVSWARARRTAPGIAA